MLSLEDLSLHKSTHFLFFFSFVLWLYFCDLYNVTTYGMHLKVILKSLFFNI